MGNCFTTVTNKTALWQAIERGNTVDFEWILKCGADVNKTYHSRQTPLMFAVEKGRTEYLQALFDAGANIDSVDAFGMSSVMIAAKKGHLDCLRLLVNAGASFHLRDLFGRTALHIAVEENRCECTQYLIEAGADIYQYDFDGIPAIMFATHVNCEKCLQSFIEAGASVNEFNKCPGISPLPLSVLINLGAKIDPRKRRGRTSMRYAAREGRVNSLRQLIKAGANVNLADYRGQTTLMIAAEAGHVECVECLAKGGAKLEQQDTKGRTALMLAAAKGHHDVLRVLLQYGEQWKDLQCNLKKTALIYAIVGFYKDYISMAFIFVKIIFNLKDNPPILFTPYFPRNYKSDISSKCLEVLLAAGANPNICDSIKMSPLMLAASLDKTGELCQQLIDAGADVNYLAEVYYTTTPLLFAVCYGNVKSVRVLVESGASVNVAELNGDRPLIDMIYNDYYLDTIYLLTISGFNMHAKERSGITPLMCAARDPAGIDIMSLLIKAGADVNRTDSEGYSALDYIVLSDDTLLMNARYLLQNGANPMNTSVGHLKSTMFLAIENRNLAFLLLLLKSNLKYQINCDDFFYLVSTRDRKMLQAFVLEGVTPVYNFPYNRSYEDNFYRQVTTLDQGCLGIFKYLLSVGYLSIFDIYWDKPKLRTFWWGSHIVQSNNTKTDEFYESPYAQPWPLVKLAFVVVSSNMGTSFERKDHIKNSGLPDRIQRMLLFQEPISKLCISCWDSIPVCFNPQDYENLPKPRPLLYYWPFGHDLTPCDCHECSQSGYKFVSR